MAFIRRMPNGDQDFYARTPKGKPVAIQADVPLFDSSDFVGPGIMKVEAIVDVRGTTFDGAKSIVFTNYDTRIRTLESPRQLEKLFADAGQCKDVYGLSWPRVFVRAAIKTLKPLFA